MVNFIWILLVDVKIVAEILRPEFDPEDGGRMRLQKMCKTAKIHMEERSNLKMEAARPKHR